MSVRSLSIVRHLLSGITSFFGARQDLSGVEEEFAKARQEAIDEMIARAKRMGADEVIGIHIEMSEISSAHRDGLLVSNASGTAVRYKRKQTGGQRAESGSQRAKSGSQRTKRTKSKKKKTA